jgi:ketosteroid isomerase-like protein
VSEKNVEVFLAVVQAVNRGDAEASVAVAATDCVVFPLRSAVEAGYQGHEGLRRFLADTQQTFEVFQVHESEVRDLGEQVLATGTIHVRGRGGGVETDIPTAGVASFRDGKMTKWKDFGDRHEALKAVGLEE